MKKPIFKSIAALLFAGMTTASCDSCNKKQDSVPADSTTIGYTETDTTQTGTGGNSDEASSQSAPIPSQSTREGKRKTPRTQSEDKSLKGYSAPDGTDAENHDGDQYTRNDNTPMPTGVPVK